MADTLELPPRTQLRRVLTFWPLVFYGLGVIVGAGIYVALGAVLARAGSAAPFSFMIAGIAAALTGLCYAELAGRFPEAAGAAAYVQIGFGSRRLGMLTGVVVTVAVAIATASIARGAIYYLREFLPLPDAVLTVSLVAGFTAMAAAGIEIAVGFAALIGAVEIGALIVAIIAGISAAPEFDLRQMLPDSPARLQGVLAGAFIAFFSFIGFETLANMAEEVKEPTRTLPRGIITAVAASMLLYVAVAFAAALGKVGAENPLLAMFKGRLAIAFAVAAFFAVANGVVVQIVMLARLFYGMAGRAQLPDLFHRINPRTQTPVNSTLAAGMVVLIAALVLPFEKLLVIADGLTLLAFVLVDLALWRIKNNGSKASGFTVPSLIPLGGAAISILMIAGELLT